MNLEQLERKLLAAARAHPPSEAVPYAFEQRVLARLHGGRAAADGWAWWSGMLWRAVAPCLAVVLLLMAYALTADFPGNGADSLDADLETAVYAGADGGGESW